MSQDNHKTLKYYATTPTPLSGILAAELIALGAESVRARGAGVEFQGNLELGYRVCLWSRLASRVLLPIARFEAGDAQELYDGGKSIDWQAHLGADDTISIACTQQRAKINHTGFAALKLKDSLADYFRDRDGRRPSVDTEDPQLRIQLHLAGGEARVAIDFSGESLHRRGYRQAAGPAPLKETLAAALLIFADWPQIVAKGGSFVDPMCGAGTLVIEALMMAADIAPGSFRRRFGFQGWHQHQAPLWENLLQEASERREQGLKNHVHIRGSDNDPTSIELTQASLHEAGLEAYVELARCAIDEYQQGIIPNTERGLVASNPPYGQRLRQSDLTGLYGQLGSLRHGRFRAWQFAFITPEEGPELGPAVPVSTTAVNNGPLECKIQVFAAEPSSIDFAHMDINVSAFRNRIIKNLKHRRRWAQRNDIYCYRLYDADLPDFAFAIDVYSSDEIWVHIQEYAAPKNIEPERVEARRLLAHETIIELLEISPLRLISKSRQRQRGDQQYQRMDDSGQALEVLEGGCRFIVNLRDHLDTGLFLDHRPLRLKFQELAKDCHFLNLFAYTASASVHAAMGGAASTLSVDLSPTYRDWGMRNLALNRRDRFMNRYLQADCMDWLETQAEDPEQLYDIIFCDPPTFSNSKRMRTDFDVQRDHVKLIQTSMKLLADKGALYFSSNRRGFKLDEELNLGFTIEDISRSTLPEDFRNRPNVHKAYKITFIS